MRTGLTKREKTTGIYFDEYGNIAILVKIDACGLFSLGKSCSHKTS